jgi:hypothetical protein
MLYSTSYSDIYASLEDSKQKKIRVKIRTIMLLKGEENRINLCFGGMEINRLFKRTLKSTLVFEIFQNSNIFYHIYSF